MTPKYVRSLSGLALRKAVAETLGYVYPDDAPPYESSISDAFPLAEKYDYAVIPVGDEWFAYPSDYLLDVIEYVYADQMPEYRGDSASEAICRCFLMKEVH